MTYPLTFINLFETQNSAAQQELEVPEREHQEQQDNVGPTPVIPPGGGCDTNPGPLLKGSTGDRVKNLQSNLKTLNFDPRPVDGIFGDNTEAEVKQFQKSKGLLVDGVVGPNTQEAICSGLQNPDVQSGVGELLGPGESQEAPLNAPPQDAEPEEEETEGELPVQAVIEENEAISPSPDLLASLENKNIVELETNESFAIGSTSAANNSTSLSPGATAQNITAPSVGAGPPKLTATTTEGINQSRVGFTPPDVAVAAGVRRVVEMVNGAVQVFEKVGDKLDSDEVLRIRDFFKVTTSNFVVDPNIVFDPVSKIFFASIMDLNTSSIRVAVSKPDVASTTSLDPSNWQIFNFPIGNCPDQPFIAVSSDKVAISVNTFIKSSNTTCASDRAGFLGAQNLLINKNDLIAGVANPAFNIENIVSVAKPDRSFLREVPVRTFGTDEKIILVSIGLDTDLTVLNAVRMKIISGQIRSDLPLFASQIFNQTVPFIQNEAPETLRNALQPGASSCDNQAQANLCVRIAPLKITGAHMSSDDRFLWLTFHEACKNPAPSPARQLISCIRLVEIDTNSGQIGSPKAVVTQDFNIVRRDMDLYYPTVTFDGSNDLGTSQMIVGFGGSNSTVFPSLFASGQILRTTLPLIVLKHGTGSIPNARYGDYFGSAVDPTDGTIRWIGGEFVVSSPPRNNWSTAIGKVTLASSITGSSQTGNGTAITSGDGAQLQPQNATTTITPPLAEQQQQQFLCADGSTPDSSTGLCADGTQPQPQNATTTITAPLAEQQQQQFLCADGSSPDPSTGLCADGTQPQPSNATAAAGPLAQQQQLFCADGFTPDPSTGLCADGTQSQLQNTSTIPAEQQQQQLVCADSYAPDPSTGLCADGTRPQTLNVTGATTPPLAQDQQQLLCADGTQP